MKRFLTVWISILLMPAGVFAQGPVPVTTFTITALESEIAALGLPNRARQELAGALDQASSAYLRGAGPSAISFLERFALLVQAQPANAVPPARAADFVRRVGFISDALRSGLRLGGETVGPSGAVLEVADPNSPAYRARLQIPAGAIDRPVFVSMSVRAELPANRALTFQGSGLVLGPPGLELGAAATLEFPYTDLDRDGTVDGTDFPAELLKVGAADAAGRIAFPRRRLDRESQTQAVEVFEFAAYWNVAWRWGSGVLTYKLTWPADGVARASDMTALGNAVRSGVEVWNRAIEPWGIRFEEVAQSQPAAVRFGFFSTRTPLSVINATGGSPAAVVPGLARGLGDGAAQVYARANPLTAGEGFAVTFNSDFGQGGLSWTAGHLGDPSAVSIEAVTVHALGHVLGLDDVSDTVQPPVMATGADLLRPEVCLSAGDLDALSRLYGVREAFPACPHASIEDLPAAYDFGSVPADVAREESFTIRNRGTGTLLIRSIEATGPFEPRVDQTRMALRPGEATTFEVAFQPSGPGDLEGQVRVVSNSRDPSPVIGLRASAPYALPGCTLRPSLRSIVAGEPLTLGWSLLGHPDSAVVEPGIGPVAPGPGPGPGEVEIAPQASTTYTLRVSNPAGEAACTARVEVARAVSSTVIWTRQFGSRGEDVARGLAAGPWGVFVAGEVGGTSSSTGEGFLALHDLAGDPVWERRIAESRIAAVVADGAGVYVTGSTEAALSEDPHRGGFDAFVRKYDLEGREMWTRQFGTSSTDQASSVALDTSGVYVVGVTGGVLEGAASAGGLDGFVGKYSHDGVPLWLRQFGSSGDDAPRAVAVSGDAVYLGGDLGGTLPGQTSLGGTDAFLRRYTGQGEEVWTRQFGGARGDYIASVAVDPTGVYVAGGTETALPGQLALGGFDAFLRKYDPGGQELWTRQFGTALNESAAGVAVDTSGIFVVGATEGTMPGQTRLGALDAFLRAYDKTGAEIWTRYLGTAALDNGFAVSPYHLGVYVAGGTRGSFGASPSEGGTDAWFVKALK
jgi:hypothetical protein